MQDEPKKPDKAAVQTEEIAELITEDHVAKLLVVDRMKPSTICRVTGLSKEQLWGIRKDPQFQRKLRKLRADVKSGRYQRRKEHPGRPPKAKRELNTMLPSIVAAYVNCGTVKGAAAELGVGTAKMNAWINEPSFQLALERVGKNLLEKALAEIEADSLSAARTLREIMNNEKSNIFARLNAAKTILEFAMKAAELKSLKMKVRRLEEIAGITQVSEITGNIEEISKLLKGKKQGALPPGGVEGEAFDGDAEVIYDE